MKRLSIAALLMTTGVAGAMIPYSGNALAAQGDNSSVPTAYTIGRIA